MKILRALTGSILFAGLMSFAPFASSQDHDAMAGHLIFSSGLHAHLFWEQGPQGTGESIMRIEFMNGATHAPTEIKSVPSVSLFMPDMGHGSSPTALQRVLDERGQVKVGVYRVLNMYFVMAGNWEVRVQLNNQDGSAETQILKVAFGGSGDNGEGGHHH
jgi:hypothetical protein